MCISIFLCSVLLAHGQVSINMDMIRNTRNVNVKMIVKDAETEEPVPFASVYLVPQGDTTIVEFGLTDKDGLLAFRQVPSGRYNLNIEMMGYQPYKKQHNFKNWQEDLGEILLDVNKEFLKSAHISAAGNPIRILKDTVEFNASSFRVGQNAMLEDLLKKMPGMEVDGGSVKLNGEKIDRITVGGKTFFFNNPTAALKNLPAQIIDKIKVIDREKDDAAFTGVSTKDDKEKIMDVLLKKEFQKGWFGNVSIGAGGTIVPDSQNEMIDNRGVLYNGSATVSSYNEKDQLVMIGNAYNAMDGSASMLYSSRGFGNAASSDYSSMSGLPTSAMAGANYNTQRIKGMETSASLDFKNSTKLGKKESFRTSMQQDGPDLNTNSSYNGSGHENEVGFNVEIKNGKRSKYHLDFHPNVSYSRSHADISNFSETASEGKKLNSNSTTSSSNASIFANGLDLSAGIRDLGKADRVLKVRFNYSYNDADGTKKELTRLESAGKKKVDLTYDSDEKNLAMGGNITYVEPLG